jgi:glycosyltransferase involved in cell wall biosynthesis
LKKLSIITINKNNSHGLLKTAQSISQISSSRIGEIDWIVIDGNSTDQSLKIVDEYKSIVGKCISEDDAGIYNAMNKGLLLSEAEYVIFMNSGDCFSSINQFVEALLNTTADIVYGDLFIQTIGGKLTLIKQIKELDFAFMLGKTINHQSYCIKRKLAQKHLFSFEYKIVADWVQLFEILKFENVISQYIEIPICIYDGTGVSSTLDDLRIQERESYLSNNYSTWELNSLVQLSRIRQRPWYDFIIRTLDSPKRSYLIKIISRIL